MVPLATPMNRHALLHQTAEFALRRFDHAPDQVHEDPDREVAQGWGMAFVQHGSFDVVVNGRRRRHQAGSVFLTHPGMTFRCHHADGCHDDVCLSLAFGEGAVAGLEDTWRHSAICERGSPSPRLSFVHERLSRAVAELDAFGVERWTLAGLAALAADARAGGARGVYTPRTSDVDAVAAVCRSIELDPAAHLSIADRARAVMRTAPALTHAFRRFVGVSPHQYVVKHRLALATTLLSDGLQVSTVSLTCGFENLSHFCRSFHRHLGVAPSRWNSLSPNERRRKVQALLTSAP